MGDLYHPNQLYALELAQFQTTAFTLGPLLTQNYPSFMNNRSDGTKRSFGIYMRGLPWRNSSYSTTSRCNHSSAHIASFLTGRVRDNNTIFNNVDTAFLGEVVGVNRVFFNTALEYVDLTIIMAAEAMGRIITVNDSNIIDGANKIMPQYRTVWHIYKAD